MRPPGCFICDVTFAGPLASKQRMEKEQAKKSPLESLPAIRLDVVEIEPQRARLRAGELCPQCKTERLDYDGLLNLSCPQCGVAVGGCFT
jgi:hypothetical protein